MTRRAPSLARYLLRRAVPPDAREDVVGDLQEMFARRHARDGAARARLWYWWQVVSFTWHFLVHSYRERNEHRGARLGMSWIDVKLAARMLVRYPGLTIVSVIGMAVGIAIAAAAFTIFHMLLDPAVPLDEGDRVVSIQNWDAASNSREYRALHDFATWRSELRSVQDIGTVGSGPRNLIAPGGAPETLTVARMTASGFSLARVAPLLGRHFVTDDEREGSAPVVVIGHGLWRRRFASDPSILGRSIHLGDTAYTVIGVMPEGFAFPVNHEIWVPLQLDPSHYAPLTGPSINVFARLAPGATLESAQAELTAIGQRAAATYPRTHAQLRPRVVPYTFAYTDMDDPDNALGVRLMQTLVVLLLIVVCVNVAILVYARTATRQAEIAVRSALGASRRRIVAQLFVEALVLSSVAAIVGLSIVGIALRYVDAAMIQMVGRQPFWVRFGLSPQVALYVVAFTMLCAIVVGVIPGLKATGRRVQSGLQGLSAGGGSRMQMGRTWTFLIVAQVGCAVALLPATVFNAWGAARFRTAYAGFAAHEFLTAEVFIDSGQRKQLGGRLAEIQRRLEAEPEVLALTFAMAPPGAETAAVIEIEGVGNPADPVHNNIVAGSRAGHQIRFNRVAENFFRTFDVPVLTGRALRTTDGGVVVNRAFARHLLGDSDALGKRIKYVGRSREASASTVELGQTYEIVGIVSDFPAFSMHGDASDVRVYHVASPGDVHPATMTMRLRGTTPASFADRVRTISAAVDPNLQLRDLRSMDTALKSEQGFMRIVAVTLALMMCSVVGLSAAGIHAMMSFTVARRRKEIGIRTALGADPQRILSSIFARALKQLAAGTALGIAGAAAVEQVLEGDLFRHHVLVILPFVVLFMTAVGVLAALGPARRGLRIQPTEALRQD